MVGVLNWSRASEISAVSREVPMTKELLTFLSETQGTCMMIFLAYFAQNLS